VFWSEQTDATTSLPINHYKAAGALDRRSKNVLILDTRLFKFDQRGRIFAGDDMRRRARKRAGWIDLTR
jgi:hypothetical protein